jgi:hypothetical protein
MMSQEEIAELHREAEIELKKYPGVVGVGFGFKRKGGETTDQLAFTVYVVEKKSPGELRPEELIPREFKGFPTDVAKVPQMKMIHCVDMDHHSPLIGGISISTFKQAPNSEWPSGTLGCFATIDGVQPPENVVLLTNHHVLLKFGEQVGDTVYQPKFIESNGQVSIVLDQEHRNPIGKIHNAGIEDNHPFTFPGESQLPYFVDAATAKLDISISSWCDTNCGVHFKNLIRGLNINGNSVIESVANVRQSTLAALPAGSSYEVYKVGRRTGRTKGKVTNVAVGPFPNGATNVIEIEALEMDSSCAPSLRFADEGDSGSVLVNSQNQVVGLVFGVDLDDPKIAFACHIAPVLDKLKVTLIDAGHPHPAADTLLDLPGVVAEDGANHTTRLKERLLGTDAGREIYNLVMTHRFEVVELVNRCRPVTVAWRRARGPAFLAHLLNNARNPAHVVPREIEGVTRETLIRNMARALAAHGSPGLRALAESRLDDALARAGDFDSLHELVGQLG